MTEQPSNANRRFTTFELVAYVSAFGVLFGVVRLAVGTRFAPTIALWFPVLFSSLVGLGVTVLTNGRQWAVKGAVVGGLIPVVLWVVLMMCLILYEWTAN